MPPKIAKNMGGLDARISFPEMLQTLPKGNFSSHKLRLARRESKEADVESGRLNQPLDVKTW